MPCLHRHDPGTGGCHAAFAHRLSQEHLSWACRACTGTFRAEVDAWVDWCLGVEEPLLTYILPIVLPVRPYEDAAYAKGKADLSRQLEALELHLASSGRTFLTGQALSLADVLVAWTLITPFMVVRARAPSTCTSYCTSEDQLGTPVWRYSSLSARLCLSRTALGH